MDDGQRAGPSVPFMHPDRLAIWSNELMNAVGVASSLLGGYKEKVAKGNSSRSISITQEHMLLQVDNCCIAP